MAFILLSGTSTVASDDAEEGAFGRVAPQFTRDGRRRPAERLGDRPKRQADGFQIDKPITLLGRKMGLS